MRVVKKTKQIVMRKTEIGTGHESGEKTKQIARRKRRMEQGMRVVKKLSRL